MKITSIEVIPVKVPVRSDRATFTAHGLHVVSHYAIVKVHTDAGLVGLGEATVQPRWTGETPASCIAAIEGIIGPALAGFDPTAINLARARMDRVIKANPFTKAAVEMALWDIAGKAAGVPVHRLLGGKVRDVVPVKMVVGAFDPPEARAMAERFLAAGVRTIKVKTGLGLEADVARVAAVREAAGPDVPITIDSNCGWNYATARLALERMRPLGIRVAEQPIPPGDNAAMAALRHHAGVPIMADESVFTPADAFGVLQAGAADVISVYPGKNGGIAGAVEIAAVARAAGVVCHMGSNLELGIASAAMIHVACAVASIDSETYPADILGPLYHESDLLRVPLAIGPEGVRALDGPGLGVDLDERAVAKYRFDPAAG